MRLQAGLPRADRAAIHYCCSSHLPSHYFPNPRASPFESKVGYVSATDFIRKQAAKDAELLATKQVNEVVWHFFRSADTGKIGPSAPLKKLLEGYGIKVIVYN